MLESVKAFRQHAKVCSATAGFLREMHGTEDRKPEGAGIVPGVGGESARRKRGAQDEAGSIGW